MLHGDKFPFSSVLEAPLDSPFLKIDIARARVERNERGNLLHHLSRAPIVHPIAHLRRQIAKDFPIGAGIPDR